MKHSITIIFIFITTCIATGQNIEKRHHEKNDVLLKLSPLNVLNATMPTVEFGASFFLEQNLEIQAKFSKKIDFFDFDDPYKTDGFKFTLEYRYYIKRRVYLAIENGGLKNKSTETMTYYETADDQFDNNDIVDEFISNDLKLFIVPKGGFTMFLGKKVIIDFYGGLGVQYQQRTIDDLEFDENNGNVDSEYYEWFGPNYTELDEFNPRFTLGFNLCYRF